MSPDRAAAQDPSAATPVAASPAPPSHGAGEPGAPIDDARRGDRDVLVDVLYPSIWLIFLAFPLVALVRSDLDPVHRVLGVLALVAFAVVYVASWWHPMPFDGLGHRATTVLWLAALIACQALLVPLIGGGVMGMVTFLVALLVFRLPLREALVAAFVLDALVVALLVLLWPQHLGWAVPVVVVSTVMLVVVRSVVDREDRGRAVAEQLRLSRQREALGRDVHDLLGHSLTVITLKTELARRLLEKDPERAAAELDEVLLLSREATSEVRLAVGRLRSPEWPAQIASARSALQAAEIEAELPAPETVPAAEQTLLAWCLREAVTNVIRHAQAARCSVRAEPGLLVVEDDGVGLPAQSSSGEQPASGNGLRGMRERVQQAGGRLSLGPAHALNAPGRPGTRLEVRLP